MKFTSLFVRRPPIRPPSAHPSDHKKLFLTLSLSDVQRPTWCQSYTICIGPRLDIGCRTGAMSREVFYGRSVRRSEGSRTAKGIVRRRTADGRKFLLLFRTAQFITRLCKKRKSLSRTLIRLKCFGKVRALLNG